ncbi:MAG: hypothetical protein J07HR59_00162 [Halorubrum sp. J07HR59]|nr:MAG: hypothetical protein J07HR59_00162 [Halorubrum sp. J07HR59]
MMNARRQMCTFCDPVRARLNHYWGSLGPNRRPGRIRPDTLLCSLRVLSETAIEHSSNADATRSESVIIPQLPRSKMSTGWMVNGRSSARVLPSRRPRQVLNPHSIEAVDSGGGDLAAVFRD